jgi:hypothetical protein
VACKGSTAFCTACHSSVEVYIGDLEVVLPRDRFAVADPSADDVCGERLAQFRLPRAAKILERLAPRFQTGSGNDPVKFRAQVRATVASDDVDRPRLGCLEFGREVFLQLREHRDHPCLVAFKVLQLRHADVDPASLPINVIPC